MSAVAPRPGAGGGIAITGLGAVTAVGATLDQTATSVSAGVRRMSERPLAGEGGEPDDLGERADRGRAATLEPGEDGALEGLKTARYRGLIGHIGISSHHLDIAERAITCGEFDTVMIEYSAFFPQSAPLIGLAAERDVGVIVMRPLGGSGRTSTMRGRLADGYSGPLTPANLLRYVLSHPGVSVAIPGARYPSRIVENVATASSYEPMTLAERRKLEQAAAELY